MFSGVFETVIRSSWFKYTDSKTDILVFFSDILNIQPSTTLSSVGF